MASTETGYIKLDLCLKRSNKIEFKFNGALIAKTPEKVNEIVF